MHWTHQFFMHSKSDVRGFFCLRFCLPWARILRLFPCFACTGHISFSCIPKVMLKVFRAAVLYAMGTNPADVPQFRLLWTHQFSMHSKSDVGGFFCLRFCLPWARILRLFPCFACTGHIRFSCIPKVMLKVFRAAVLYALGTSPADVPLFRMHWTHLFFMHSTKNDVRGFLWLRFCLPWARILRLFPVSHALDTSDFYAFQE